MLIQGESIIGGAPQKKKKKNWWGMKNPLEGGNSTPRKNMTPKQCMTRVCQTLRMSDGSGEKR